MKSANISDFTKGNTTRLILAFFGPLLLTSMLQQLYNFVDTLIVGKGLGDNALAAVGNMGSIFFLVVGFSMGLSNGFGILIAQSFGAKNYDKLRRSLASTIQLSTIIAIGLTILSVVFLPGALRLLNTDEAIMPDSLKYGYFILGGLSASILYNVSSCILRSLGDSKTPLKAIIVSSVVNLGLDAFFIFIMKTGVEGAAIATVFSQLVSAAICIRQLRRIEIIRISRSDFKNPRSLYFEMLKNGIPMALMSSITAIGCMVVQSYVNNYGVAYTSAYSVCSKYDNLFMNPAFTAGNAMSAYTSQNYGAREYGRIREGLRVCLAIALITFVLLGGLMVLIPRQLAGFLLEGEEPIALAAEFFPIAGLSLIAVDFLFVYRSGVQSMGRPLVPMISGIAEMVTRILVIVLFMGTIGFKATAFAETAAWTSACLLNMVAFYRILLPKLAKKEKQQAIAATHRQPKTAVKCVQ